MRPRVFIAINLPEDIKNELISFQKKWPNLPCRWTKKENLHITLLFLGHLNEEELLKTCKIIKEAASRNKSFLINLTKIIYGPPQKILKKSWVPRMIWVEGKKSKELEELQRDLKNSLSAFQSKPRVKEGKRGYTPHITLGRIKQWEFRQIEPEERPEFNEEISLSFEVKSIEIMESKLKPKGPDYFVLESVQLVRE